MAGIGNNLDELQARQYAFAAHIRDPEGAPAPADIEDRRMNIYRQLFINNVTSFLTGHFPIVSEILGTLHWHSLVRDFYRDHQSHSPLFPDLPREFLSYLSEERCSNADDPPFLLELAHYEWVEAGVRMAPDVEMPDNIDAQGDLLTDIPVLSSPAWLLAYEYPVNEINAEQVPEGPAEKPLHYLVYRDADNKVVFNKLNAVSARLFELLQNDSALSGRAALEQVAAELNHPNPTAVIKGGAGILDQWRSKSVVLGTLPPKPA